MSMGLNFAPDRYEIPIRSRSVTRVYVETNFDIEFMDAGSESAVLIDNPIAVVSENERPATHIRADEQVYGNTIGVFGKIVVSGTAFRKGRMLEVMFNDGVWFHVEPAYMAEEDGPLGNKGLLLICMPHGQLAVWFGVRKKVALAEELTAAMV
jgi:Family of unknown function (DUF6188)